MVSKNEIYDLLDNYHVDVVKAMAEAADMAKDDQGKALRKGDLLERMKRDYFTPERIRASYAKLRESDKAVFNRALLQPGNISHAIFKRQLVRANLAQEAPVEKNKRGYGQSQEYEASPHRHDSLIFEDILARLTYHGLLFSHPSQLYSGYSHKLRFGPGDPIFIPQRVPRRAAAAHAYHQNRGGARHEYAGRSRAPFARSLSLSGFCAPPRGGSDPKRAGGQALSARFEQRAFAA